MGAKDTPLVTYFSDEVRYADLINGHILDGEQIVSPEDVQEMDGRVVGILEHLGRKTKRIYVEKYRDLVRRIVRGTIVVIVGLENQDQVHYAMPIRILVEDAADYDKQMRKIQRRHRRERDVHGAEFLGGFSKEDKVYPVVTIVLYYGEEPWDGAKDLYGLMNLEDIPEKMRSWINNYPIHILDVRRYPGVEKFQSDLREIFGFL